MFLVHGRHQRRRAEFRQLLSRERVRRKTFSPFDFDFFEFFGIFYIEFLISRSHHGFEVFTAHDRAYAASARRSVVADGASVSDKMLPCRTYDYFAARAADSLLRIHSQHASEVFRRQEFDPVARNVQINKLFAFPRYNQSVVTGSLHRQGKTPSAVGTGQDPRERRDRTYVKPRRRRTPRPVQRPRGNNYYVFLPQRVYGLSYKIVQYSRGKNFAAEKISVVFIADRIIAYASVGKIYLQYSAAISAVFCSHRYPQCDKIYSFRKSELFFCTKKLFIIKLYHNDVAVSIRIFFIRPSSARLSVENFAENPLLRKISEILTRQINFSYNL